MKFRPSLIVEEFIEGIHTRVGARNKAVLGRAGLFLALGIGVPPAFEPTDSKGKDLDDETVVPDELRDTVRAALSYRSGRMLDESASTPTPIRCRTPQRCRARPTTAAPRPTSHPGPST